VTHAVSKPEDLNIDHVANLARISLTPAEKERFSAQIGDVLAYIAQLNEVDVSGVEPTAHAFPVTNVWAADVAAAGLPVEDALRNAPEKRDNMFVVPKVVD
jgi:aspartyl-tRNA(Asn)/glutamyl-tRNA(Gln) amidotransferase subunit C